VGAEGYLLKNVSGELASDLIGAPAQSQEPALPELNGT
jgi:hypothetical protein